MLATGCALISSVLATAPAARADDGHRQAIQRIVRLDQDVHIMSMEWSATPRQANATADARVIDAEGLLARGRTDEAATLLLSVLREWPRSRAAQDATFLLGEALFRLGDYLSSRSFYEEAVGGFTGTRREQRAVSRLIEIALHTGDYQPVDRYLKLLGRVPQAQLDPCVPYVRAKLDYQRGQLDQALAQFSAIPATSPFGAQAAYFVGTIRVKNHDLPAAAAAFDSLLRTPPPPDDPAAREVHDLAQLAAARICLDQERLDCARDHYQAVQADSKVLTTALYELGFTHIRAKQFDLAQATFERLLEVDPDGAQVFDVRVLVGNLWLRRGDFTTAQRWFSKTSAELTPSHDRLRAVVAASETATPPGEATFPSGLAAMGVEGIARGAFETKASRNWVLADPEAARLLRMAKDIADAPVELTNNRRSLRDIEAALANPDSRTLFPDLTRSRSALTRISTELLNVRAHFAEQARRGESRYLASAEAERLDASRTKLAEIEEGLSARLTRGNLEPSAPVKMPDEDRYAAPEGRPGSRKDSDEPRQLAAWQPLRQARYETLSPDGAAAIPVAAVRPAPSAPMQLKDLLRDEERVHLAVRTRMTPDERNELDRDLEVLSRADAVLSQLVDLDARIDGEIDRRLGRAKDFVAARHLEIAEAEKTIGVVEAQARDVDEDALRALRTHLAARLASLVVLADVGLIDVAWASKSKVTSRITAQQTKKNQEASVIRDAMDRERKALAKHFVEVTAWAKAAGVPIRDPEGD
ncbi:MAG TPA: tetratricopeptide repeat protein [Polyangia bacterium]|nr:tetratricopeptide repeat protein [Polyangia bacterium]